MCLGGTHETPCPPGGCTHRPCRPRPSVTRGARTGWRLGREVAPVMWSAPRTTTAGAPVTSPAIVEQAPRRTASTVPEPRRPPPERQPPATGLPVTGLSLPPPGPWARYQDRTAWRWSRPGQAGNHRTRPAPRPDTAARLAGCTRQAVSNPLQPRTAPPRRHGHWARPAPVSCTTGRMGAVQGAESARGAYYVLTGTDKGLAASS